jgi:DNA-directed RNA polymerase specialized sigma24 family protein
MRAPRENAIWMRDLRACGLVQAEAITDLRGLLLREPIIERALALGRDDTTSPAQHAEQHAIVETLRRLIEEALTDTQWMAMTAELGGMPLEEIARRMGSNVNAVYKLLHDARKRLKHELETAGYTAEDVRSAFA